MSNRGHARYYRKKKLTGSINVWAGVETKGGQPVFLSISNFNGPVAFIIPDSWSKISTNYAFDYGCGHDNRDGRSKGGAQEINTVPYFEIKDPKGTEYSKIPELKYPVEDKSRTILIQDILCNSIRMYGVKR